MDVGILNPHVARIIISARGEDSINAISRRIGLSYGWTHKWVKELTGLGVFRETRTGLFLNADNPFYRRTLDYIRDGFRDDVQFHYAALPLFGVKYCFTKTDAVYVWTEGGYNISRYRGYYPIFIRLAESDWETFKGYCRKLGLKTGSDDGIRYMPELSGDFKVAYHKGVPVDSLDDTIAYMKANIYNFEPALEMVQNAYKRKLGVKYAEAVSNV